MGGFFVMFNNKKEAMWRALKQQNALKREIEEEGFLSAKKSYVPSFTPKIGAKQTRLDALKRSILNAKSDVASFLNPQRVIHFSKEPSTLGATTQEVLPIQAPTPMPTPQEHFYPEIDNEWAMQNREKLKLPFKQERYGSPKPLPEDLRSAVNEASRTYGVPKEALYSLAYNESGFNNIPEHEGGGGRGYFQYDLTQRPDVTEQMAMDPNWAAMRTAQELRTRMETTNPYTGQPYTLWEAIAAHNVGPNGVYSDVISPYYGVPLKDRAKEYADNIFNYISDRDWER